MTGVLHPDQFGAAVASFKPKAKSAGWHTESGAAGQCYDASHAFAGHLTAQGITNHKVVEYTRPVDEYERDDPAVEEHENHYVNVVKHGGKSHVVDWTANQFGSHGEGGTRRPHPEIQSEPEFRRSGDWEKR